MKVPWKNLYWALNKLTLFHHKCFLKAIGSCNHDKIHKAADSKMSFIRSRMTFITSLIFVHVYYFKRSQSTFHCIPYISLRQAIHLVPLEVLCSFSEKSYWCITERWFIIFFLPCQICDIQRPSHSTSKFPSIFISVIFFSMWNRAGILIIFQNMPNKVSDRHGPIFCKSGLKSCVFLFPKDSKYCSNKVGLNSKKSIYFD